MVLILIEHIFTKRKNYRHQFTEHLYDAKYVEFLDDSNIIKLYILWFHRVNI